MKILLISPKNRTVYNFRGDLISEMIAKGHTVVVTGPDTVDLEKIEALGVTFHVVPMNKNGTNIVGDIKYMLRLRKLIKEEKPDATLAYTVKPVVYGAMAASLAGVKNINSMITGGGYTFTSTSLKAKLLGIIVKTLYKIALGKSKNIIFQNPDDLKEFTNSHLCHAEKCHVVNGSGVNTEKFTVSDVPQNKRFLMISRLLKSKGVCEYLEAARIVKERHPDVEFALLGKYEASMQDAVPRETVEAYIRDGIITRYDETPDIAAYYRDCYAYVLPSYREGTPRTVLEAMACGRAVITTDAPGCRETVCDGENGYLVPVKDAWILAERMEQLLSDRASVELMGKQSRRLCEEKYDVKKVNASILHIMKL